MSKIKSLFEIYVSGPKKDKNFTDPSTYPVDDHEDRSGNGDEVFKASKVKTVDRNTKEDPHGYAAGEDESKWSKFNKPKKNIGVPAVAVVATEEAEIDEAREMSPTLKAAQANLLNPDRTKKTVSKKHTWHQSVIEYDKDNKSMVKKHKDLYQHHSQEAKEAENMFHDLKSGNLGIDPKDKDAYHGAEDEIDAKVNHHLEKATHHHQKMHYYNSLLTKPYKLKEEVEDLDEISAQTLGSYIQKSKKDENDRKDYGRAVSAELSKRTGMSFGTPFDRKLYSQKHGRPTYQKLAIKKLTGDARVNANEENINTVYDKFIAPKLDNTPLSEKFTLKVESYSNKTKEILSELFESLDEDNQKEMLGLLETKEGLNEVLDFILEN